ncbi:hypothetical protein L1L84_005211, partial [Salmonella enterica]|nr:hypothetical protein [Salmonella enterica]
MDKFDRPRQRLFLQGLYDAYPEELTNEQLEELLSSFPDKKVTTANLLYLEKHGLIFSGLQEGAVGYHLV